MADHDLENKTDIPVGLQVIAGRLEDEKVLAMTSLISAALESLLIAETKALQLARGRRSCRWVSAYWYMLRRRCSHFQTENWAVS